MFSAMSAERQANINMVGDSAGLTALRSDTDSDVVRESGSGELVIDFTAGGSAGDVNVDSVYQVRALRAPYKGPRNSPGYLTPRDDAAFFIVNQDSVEHEVTLEYDVQNIGNAQIVFQLQDEDDCCVE